MKFFLLFFSLLSFSCASYQSKVREGRVSLKSRDYNKAIEQLKPLAEKKSDDQLVYLLDYGMALHIAGQFKESNDILQKADRLADQQDYHSVTNVAGSLLLSAGMIQYKGDSYEKILINVFSALNYLNLNQPDEALVEVRRMNEKINKFRLDGRENYEQNPFGHYLSGLIWESQKKFDDAYISYESSFELDPLNPFLPFDLIRTAELAHREEALKKWQKTFQIHDSSSDKTSSPLKFTKKQGELIFIYEQGWGPEKRYSQYDVKIPVLYPSYSQTAFAKIQITPLSKIPQNGSQKEIVESFYTRRVYDIEKVSIKTLESDYGWIIARNIGGDITKYVVAKNIDDKNKGLGSLLYFALQVSDRADLRQWSTLPQTIQLARIPLNEGDYQIQVVGMDSFSQPTPDFMNQKTIHITAGKKTMLNWRSVY